MAPHRAGVAGHRVCDRLTAIRPISILIATISCGVAPASASAVEVALRTPCAEQCGRFAWRGSQYRLCLFSGFATRRRVRIS
jgi:hypothetical protein